MSTLPPRNPAELAARIDKGANQCVKCGLCLPHCPTYQVARNENESPRGRIALMQGAVQGQVPVTEKLKYHLDTCLACRACEAVCPAHVPYEELITTTRAWLTTTHQQKPLWREQVLIQIFTKPFWHNIVQSFASFVYSFKRRKNVTPPATTAGKILLLPSCASSVFDQQVTEDAKMLLRALGWQVEIPEPIQCCGALALHAGELSAAQQSGQQQLTQWQASDADYIVSLTNGCHATMQDYNKPPMNLATTDKRLFTIEEFLLKELSQKKLYFKKTEKTVLLHTPCTLRNAIRKPDVTLQLLQKIPGLNIKPIPLEISGCCGAAGTYFLRHNEIAEQLVNPIIEFAKHHDINFLSTTNIGCAMHIHQALRTSHVQCKVLHPISILTLFFSE